MRKDVERILMTDDWLAALPCPASGRKSYYDSKCTSLVLIVTATGAKSFYRAGRPSRVFIGTVKQGWNVENARKKCDIIVGEIAKGRDPVRIRRRKKRERTLGQLWEWYIEEYSKKKKRTWKMDIGIWNDGLIAWADRKLSSIKREHVIERLNALITTRGASHARHQMILLNSMFTQAKKNGWVRRRPGRGISLPRCNVRNRYLTPDELPTFFEKLKLRRQDVQDCVHVALFTGARRDNCMSMAFSEIANKTWTIPAVKAKEGKAIRIPLIDEVMDILNRRKKEADSDCDWVFPSKTAKSGHITSFNREWNKLMADCKKACGLEDFRFHDLRHTHATYQAGEGFSLEIIGAGLGHGDRESTQIYAVVDLKPVRESITRGVAAMKKAAAAKKSKKSSK